MSSVDQKHELYENARSRVRQKRRLYYHFVLFFVGSVFFIFLNKVLNIGETFLKDWYIWAILIWLSLWLLHAVNVVIFKRFMDKNWERGQTEKLILKQELKIAEMEKEMAYEAKKKAESMQSSEMEKKENSKNN